MDIKFSLDICTNEQEWSSDDNGNKYTELYCVSTDSKVGFVVYYYHNAPDEIILRNLFVKKEFRGQGIGSLVIRDLKSYCACKDKTLSLWVNDDKLKQWYLDQGFKFKNETNVIWFSYKKE